MGHWDGWMTFLAGFGCGFVSVFVLVPVCLWVGWIKVGMAAQAVTEGDDAGDSDWWKKGGGDDDGRD
jgi:hypothetical protein